MAGSDVDDLLQKLGKAFNRCRLGCSACDLAQCVLPSRGLQQFIDHFLGRLVQKPINAGDCQAGQKQICACFKHGIDAASDKRCAPRRLPVNARPVGQTHVLIFEKRKTGLLPEIEKGLRGRKAQAAAYATASDNAFGPACNSATDQAAADCASSNRRRGFQQTNRKLCARVANRFTNPSSNAKLFSCALGALKL
ncbi:MAG: hypothetical protein KGS44_12040 [Alphaproteobacteria bacterium]|nr:hypothetical protein [Alphaproteobacteria bacterium]